MVSLKKQNYVTTLVDFLKESNNFALIKFENTPHASFEKLRKELKKNDAKIRVIKNSLFERAIKKLSVSNKRLAELSSKVFPLKENSALLVLSDDYTKGLSAFFKFTKDEKTLFFKFGLLDGAVYLSEELERIAKLPAKDQLIAGIIGSLKSPSSKLVYVMQAQVAKLVYILNERGKQTN